MTKAVDPALKESAALLNEAIKEFGTTVQTLLSRHRREIIGKTESSVSSINLTMCL